MLHSEIRTELEELARLKRAARQTDDDFLQAVIHEAAVVVSQKEEMWEHLSTGAHDYLLDCIDAFNDRTDAKDSSIPLPELPDLKAVLVEVPETKPSKPKRKAKKDSKPLEEGGGWMVKEIMLDRGDSFPLADIMAILRERGINYTEGAASCCRMEFRQTLKLLRKRGYDI